MSQLLGAADVRDHRFGFGPPFTVGIEEEYMLLDPDTFELSPSAERVLAAELGGDYSERISPELFDSLIEFHTSICADAPAAGHELRALRAHAVALTAKHGLRLGSAGTHPFSLFERQSIMDRARYKALLEELQYAARRELIYGLHVHVSVPDADRAIAITNALRAHLCELVALSANSPFWRGQDTGFVSFRHLIFSGFPRSGPPPHFHDYEEYARAVDQMVAAGNLEDYTRTWWDVRPHPRFGTVEVRRYAESDATPFHPMLVQENKWRAARFGLDGIVVDPVGGAAIAIRRLVERTLVEVEPYGGAELEGIRVILRDGPGATRQLQAYAEGDGIRAVARAVADATAPRLT